jgi:hypothetical protein
MLGQEFTEGLKNDINEISGIHYLKTIYRNGRCRCADNLKLTKTIKFRKSSVKIRELFLNALPTNRNKPSKSFIQHFSSRKTAIPICFCFGREANRVDGSSHELNVNPIHRRVGSRGYQILVGT